MKCLNLKNLTVEEVNQEGIMVCGETFQFNENEAITSQWQITRDAVKNALSGIEYDWRPHLFEFKINSELSEEGFEAVVNLIVAAFFALIKVNKGRPRERRLDVPENLKTSINCNMSLLKNAINYQTLVDKLQMTISCGDLRFVLVGDFNA